MQSLADLLPNGPVLTIEDGKVIYNGRSTLLEDAATTLLHDLEKHLLDSCSLKTEAFHLWSLALHIFTSHLLSRYSLQYLLCFQQT